VSSVRRLLAGGRRSFVIVTVRSGEPCPDAIVSLWKDASAQRLELKPPSDDAVGALVEAALGGPVEQSVLRWAYETSQGNVLYVRELIAGAVDAGTLTEDRGLWHMTGSPPISRSLAVTARGTASAGLVTDVVAPGVGAPVGPTRSCSRSDRQR
jgi:hypothetical protein